MADLASKEWSDALLWVAQNMTKARREAMAAYDDAEIIDATISHFLHLNIPNVSADLDIDVSGGWMYPRIWFGYFEEWQGTIRLADLASIYAEFIAIEPNAADKEKRAWAVLEKYASNIERYPSK